MRDEVYHPMASARRSWKRSATAAPATGPKMAVARPWKTRSKIRDCCEAVVGLLLVVAAFYFIAVVPEPTDLRVAVE